MAIFSESSENPARVKCRHMGLMLEQNYHPLDSYWPDPLTLAKSPILPGDKCQFHVRQLKHYFTINAQLGQWSRLD